ncbi:MAG: zinc ribbon domain-containing protein [Phycisphaerales bacterium]|nr:zinc ribbon domain-containing protein [Phycisphaerales bacterium]
MTSQTTDQAQPDPPSSEPAKPRHDLACPSCRYPIGTPDAANCPECGAALRLEFVNGWTVNSRRWLKRLTLCVLGISVVHLAASLFWPMDELTFWYEWTNTDAQSWYSNIILFVVECWEDLDSYWPMFLGMLLSSALLAIVAVGSFRNLRLIRTSRDPEPGLIHKAWRRVFAMLLLITALTTVQLIALWTQFFRV